MGYAHVESVDALKELRAALWKFAEAASAALSEADADLQRTLNWLEQDARIYWQGQIRRKTMQLNQARESLRAKVSITRRDGTRPSAIEEQKAVELAAARLQHANGKLERVKQCAKLFQRESLQYRGLMQRFVSTVQTGIPEAAGHLDGLIASLATYTALEETVSSVSSAGSEAARPAGPEQAPSMKRVEPSEPASPHRPEGTPESSESGGSDRPGTPGEGRAADPGSGKD